MMGLLVCTAVPSAGRVIQTAYWTLCTVTFTLVASAFAAEARGGRNFLQDGWTQKFYRAADFTGAIAALALMILCLFIGCLRRRLPWAGFAVLVTFVVYQALPRF